MDILLATLGARKAAKHAAAGEILAHYRERIGHFCRCRAENYASEEKFFAATGARTAARAPGGSQNWSGSLVVLLDSRGRAFSSEQFAQWLGRKREEAVPRLVFAVGPADGWSEGARARAGLLLSLGPMTLPHELAAAVLAEQIYRAFTVIEGHPYHLGHAGG